MFSISVGTEARAHGFCCIAVGDNTSARGAFQVSVGDKVTIPNDTTKATAVATLVEIEQMRLTYKAMCDTKFAPAEFEAASSKAIDHLKNVLEKHFGKNLEGLVEDIKKEALEKEELEKKKKEDAEKASAKAVDELKDIINAKFGGNLENLVQDLKKLALEKKS